MKSLRLALLAGAAVFFALPGSQDLAKADGGKGSLKADLEGFEEVPVVSTTATGEFRVKINDGGSSFDYNLTYEDLEGEVTQAHIHLGQRGVNGGITIWLCDSDLNPSPITSTPPCPGPNRGAVRGTVTAADVIGPAGQGVSAGEFEEVLDAMRAGVTYANVHTSMAPGGEIRGQIGRGRHH